MADRVLLVRDNRPLLSVHLPRNAGQIERNAVSLLVDEIRERTGAVIPVVPCEWDTRSLAAVALGSVPPALPPDVTVNTDEGFAIRTADGVMTLAARSGAGVLYAVDHLLDSIQYSGADAHVPVTNLDDSPDCIIRGASFSSHAYGRFMEDPDDLDGMKQLIRYYARNRLNYISVEASGRKWPGDLTPIVTWKYFDPLRDPSRDEAVMSRRAMINDLIGYAHSWGVKVVLYTAEFNHDPDMYERCPELMGILPETWRDGMSSYIRGCVCLSKDIAWQYWRAKVKETMEALPDLDGLEVWTAEVPSEFGICACPSCRSKPRHEWLEKFYHETRTAMDEVNPDTPLIVKTFQSSQGSLEVERFGPLKGRLPHDTVVCTKGQFGDMAYLNDPNPLLGWIQDGEEMTEFDVGGEYRGCGMGAMICCIPEYLADRIRLYRSRGVRRFLARHVIPNWPNKEFIDINDEAFFRLTWDTDADVEAIWGRWATARFGPAADKMVELLKLSDEVVNKAIYVRRACANRHYFIFPDNLDSLKYMMVDLSAQMIAGGLELLEPTPENIDAIIREKDEAISACKAMKDLFSEVEHLLPQETRDKLRLILERSERIVIVMRYLTEAVWNYFRFERCFSVRERDGMRPDILRMVNRCEEEIDKSQEFSFARASGETWFGIRRIIDFDRARKICEEIRALLNFRFRQGADFSVSLVPVDALHPATYVQHRNELREMFRLPGEG